MVVHTYNPSTQEVTLAELEFKDILSCRVNLKTTWVDRNSLLGWGLFHPRAKLV